LLSAEVWSLITYLAPNESVKEHRQSWDVIIALLVGELGGHVADGVVEVVVHGTVLAQISGIVEAHRIHLVRGHSSTIYIERAQRCVGKNTILREAAVVHNFTVPGTIRSAIIVGAIPNWDAKV
jgi:hypothetical protein